MEQDSLPTMEIPKDPELTALAKVYKAAQERRMMAGREEKVHKEALIVMMKAKKLDRYEDADDNVRIEIEHEDKLKVKIGAGEEEGQ